MNQPERRKHPRVSLKTSVALFDRTLNEPDQERRSRPLGRFEILDLSVRGALIDGDIGVPVGTPVGVHLRLPGTHVQVGSVVVRRAESGTRTTCALRFEVVPDRDHETLERAVAAVLEELRAKGGPPADAKGLSTDELEPLVRR